MRHQSTTTCPACKGRSVVPSFKDGSAQTCPVCEGQGQVATKYNRRPYDFAFPQTAVPGSGTASVSIQLPGDYDFEWWDTVAVFTSANLLVLLEINDVRFMNSLQPGNQNGILIGNWAGTAQLPYARRFPSLLVKRDQATLYFLDQSGQTNTVSVVLRGFQMIPVDSNGMGSGSSQNQGS